MLLSKDENFSISIHSKAIRTLQSQAQQDNTVIKPSYSPCSEARIWQSINAALRLPEAWTSAWSLKRLAPCGRSMR
jgi:hypothetical protein